mmetsp:Transcript_14543/g.31661  ORF Transcript_14543/g.31661 Transcript_14543/m.31661 type:complete len:82 (+) Transcript_14543:727-972(+)
MRFEIVLYQCVSAGTKLLVDPIQVWKARALHQEVWSTKVSWSCINLAERLQTQFVMQVLLGAAWIDGVRSAPCERQFHHAA